MDNLFLALGVIAAILGALGIYFAATGRSTTTNAMTRFLFTVRGREQTRGFVALSSGSLIAFGAYMVLASSRPGVPLWPLLVAVTTYGALQIAAHLQRHDV